MALAFLNEEETATGGPREGPSVPHIRGRDPQTERACVLGRFCVGLRRLWEGEVRPPLSGRCAAFRGRWWKPMRGGSHGGETHEGKFIQRCQRWIWSCVHGV